MTPKRILFLVLLVAFIVSCGVWFFYVPYNPDKLYRAIPANAQVVSHHQILAERWDTFSANPLARTLFTSMGLDLDELDEWGGDPETRVWLDKLLARDLVIAHVPAIGPLRDPAWVLTGWIGGESIRLRWLLQRGKLEGVTKIMRHAGGSYWQVDTGKDQKTHLSISVVEGMLVGVFSADPHAARYVLDAYDGLLPNHEVLRGDTPSAAAFRAATESDRGWFMGSDGAGGEASYWFSIDEISEAGIRGSVSRHAVGDWPAVRTEQLEWPSRFFGGLPFLLAGTHPDAAYTALTGRLTPAADNIMQGLYGTDPDGLVLASVLGGEFAGRWIGITVPAMLLAWPVADEAEALARIHVLIDGLNAQWRWGLVVTPSRVLEWPVYTIESTSGTMMYARIDARDQAAFALVDGWLVMASHARALTRLLQRFDRPEALFEADQGGWQTALRDGDSTAYGYVNLAAGLQTIKLAVSGYSMWLFWQDAAGSRDMRERLRSVNAWVETLAPLGPAHVWMDQGDGVVTWRFSVGDVEEAE